MITVKINDSEIANAINRLQRAGGDLKPAMEDIGEYLTRSTKLRFAEGKGPDGTPWEPNTEATIVEFLRRKAGGTSRRKGEKGNNPYFGKDGRLNKRGAGQVMGKRPLIGESKRLSTEINYLADANSVAVGSGLEQSAVMQFGAKKGEFGCTKRGVPIPWGDIPARPFLGLSDEDASTVVAILKEHFESAMGR